MHVNRAAFSGWFSCQMVSAMKLIHVLHSETPECEGCLFVKQLFAVLVEGQQQRIIYVADKTLFNGTVQWLLLLIDAGPHVCLNSSLAD